LRNTFIVRRRFRKTRNIIAERQFAPVAFVVSMAERPSGLVFRPACTAAKCGTCHRAAHRRSGSLDARSSSDVGRAISIARVDR
jgi:hypothetical protein